MPSTEFVSFFEWSVILTAGVYCSHKLLHWMEGEKDEPFSSTPPSWNALSPYPETQFELNISLGGEHGVWADQHRFAERPGTDTIKALLAVAYEEYIALYDTAPESSSLFLEYHEAMPLELYDQEKH